MKSMEVLNLQDLSKFCTDKVNLHGDGKRPRKSNPFPHKPP